MDPKQIAKQIIQFNKTAFDNTFDALNVLQEQREKMMSMWKRIGIIICARYRDCGGGKCFRALRERCPEAFSIYPGGEAVEIVGYSTCGGCPGGNVEYVPEEMKKKRRRSNPSGYRLGGGLPPVPEYPPVQGVYRNDL